MSSPLPVIQSMFLTFEADSDAVWKSGTGVPPVKSRARCACHFQTTSTPTKRDLMRDHCKPLRECGRRAALGNSIARRPVREASLEISRTPDRSGTLASPRDWNEVAWLAIEAGVSGSFQIVDPSRPENAMANVWVPGAITSRMLSPSRSAKARACGSPLTGVSHNIFPSSLWIAIK